MAICRSRQARSKGLVLRFGRCRAVPDRSESCWEIFQDSRLEADRRFLISINNVPGDLVGVCPSSRFSEADIGGAVSLLAVFGMGRRL